MTHPVWAYIRVSGDAQADRGLPVAGQRRAVEEYAREHKLRLGRVFVDEARSGGTDQREQFQLMMQLAHQDPPPCAAVLLWSWSRFARDQDDAHYWKASLRRHGVQIIALDGVPPEITGGIDYILEAVIHWKDEQKLREISHNARRGQQTLAKMGYVPSGCPAPRGYKVAFEHREIEGRKRRLRRWIPDPETWPLAQKAWQMRLAGASYYKIWRAVGFYKDHRYFSRFFANSVYKGNAHFGATTIQVDPVVTAAEWEVVNRDRAKRRSGAYARRKGSRFLLSGLLKCAHCGSSVTSTTAPPGRGRDGYMRKRWDGYICTGRRRHQCDLRLVSARVLEQKVIDALFSDILTEENLARCTEAIARHRVESHNLSEARRDWLTAELRRVNAAIDGLLDTAERAPDSDSIADRIIRRERQRDELVAEIHQIEVRIGSAQESLAAMNDLRASLREAVDNLPRAEVRPLVQRMVAEIVLDDEQAIIKYRFPIPSSDLSMVDDSRGTTIIDKSIAW